MANAPCHPMSRTNPHATAGADGSCDDCGSFHGGYSAASMTINGVSLPVFDVEYSRKECGPILGTGTVGSCSFECTMEITAQGYRAFIAMLEPSAPRWGQRGRRRLRKARLLARMTNEAIQLIHNRLTIPRSSGAQKAS